MSRPAVSFENLSIIFGEKAKTALPLLDAGQDRDTIKRESGQLVGVADVSFDVMQGELLVLMGLSGSGKSTLLRAVNALNKPVRGRVLLHTEAGSVDPGACSTAELRGLRRQRIAMVFQQFGLLPWRTVIDNVAFGLELSGLSKKQRRAKAHEQLELVGLQGWGDKYLNELSGGMQQRVGLARAFATDADILLMDEPFSALDPLIRAHLQDELLALQEKLHKTIIFVSHDLDEAAKIGNRIAIMESARLVQIGTPQEIVANPADDYVRSFVAHMNPLAVLHAQDVMRRQTGAVPLTAATAASTAVLQDVLDLMARLGGPVYVCEGDSCLGVIDQEAALAALTGHRNSAIEKVS
ncbi:choline ABC transporter ATP-binding protein [Polycladidibacter hongkongensis]|uniref:choline ABC transporter ATP-binding protein n=1 Tax=Polycladidibacter hongkongensis TaxID=1647556 RepID=UPI0008322D08|nr:choline ABC transporter ATP-binding protein [Pseudovibrio hongkongensis]